MVNAYLKVIESSVGLPDAYRAMGILQRRWTALPGGESLTGWEVCELYFKMNRDGPEWWSNRESVAVDGHGQLWHIFEGESFEPYPPPGTRSRSVTLERLNGAQLRSLGEREDFFAKIKRAVEAMI